MSRKNTTYDRWMKDPDFKKEFEKEYKEFLLSEIFHAMKDNSPKSVRKLAEEAHLSKSVIQDISSGKQQDVKLSNFCNMAHAFGFTVVLEKQDVRIPLG